MQAYQNNLYIKSVQHTDNMYTITFSDGSAATISNGKDGEDGKDGDTLISYIVVEENEVTFVLTDGRKFSIAIYSALSIEFDEADLIVMSTNSTRKIHYTVTSIIPDVEVETVSSADIKAKVVATSKREGAIEINTGEIIDEYSKVVVFVSNGEKVIMRRLSFEEAGLLVEDNATKNASSEGGEMSLEFLSNVKCEVVIPEDAKSWISVVPDTRSMEKQTITLKLEPNTGYYRSAIVTIQSADGTLNLEYLVEQSGDLGVAIDPDAVPDNEIWYTSLSIFGKITPNNDDCFGAKLVSYWSGVWRPTENSIMRYNTGGFNAPSREAIYYRIHRLAYGDSWEYNYEDFVKYDEINRKEAGAVSTQAYRPANYKPTHPPVVVNKSWKEAK